MPKISAVIISYNEESYIEKCLGSLNGIADEIVIIDSYSTDSTELVCKKFNVRFISHEFEGYTEQKNFALSMATHKYVLSLDADEALSDELRKSILEIKDDLRYDGYIFNRRNNYCGRWMKRSCLSPDRHLRLFDSSKGKWMGPNPHDRFQLIPGTKSLKLKGDMNHWNYSSYEDHMDKMNRFSTISAKEYFKEGRKAGPCKALYHMMWRFIRSFIVEAGFLNGYDGFTYSSITAWSSFLKYSKLRKLNSIEKKC
ncbi:MAG: glycosyltransferase family 2 protein [Bacteroidales bacterium]|nr:glycosyltransferase family 2 protein [Bacteroidales bacterium]